MGSGNGVCASRVGLHTGVMSLWGLYKGCGVYMGSVQGIWGLYMECGIYMGFVQEMLIMYGNVGSGNMMIFGLCMDVGFDNVDVGSVSGCRVYNSVQTALNVFLK